MRSRRLYHVGIVHTAADLGSLAPAVRRAAGRDDAAQARHETIVAEHWRAIERWCDALPPDLGGWRVYQDGLPVCGRERAIVDELALKGSHNHRIIVSLLARGAALEGTESPELLVEELRLAQSSLATGAHSAVRAAALLQRRDAFIARRIEQTLRAGETGVLFIGMLHDVLSRLGPMIDVHRVNPSAAPAAGARTPDPHATGAPHASKP